MNGYMNKKMEKTGLEPRPLASRLGSLFQLLGRRDFERGPGLVLACLDPSKLEDRVGSCSHDP
jgi:hypothetical protein